jgi:hypothetical protein
MEIPTETYNIVGVLCYLNHPNYLKTIDIMRLADIFDAMEEKIEGLTIKIYELEHCMKVIQDKNDKEVLLDRINKTKCELLIMNNQLNFIKK